MDQNKLKSMLECPVCFEVRRDTHIVQCVNGHIVCAPCKKKIQDCPTCRGHYDTPPRRSLNTESMIRECDLEFACKFAGEGCSVADTISHLQVHETVCQYKKVTCTECGTVLSQKDLSDHVALSHSKCKNEGRGCEFTARKDELEDYHAERCQHRKVPCPYGPCTDDVILFDVTDHIRKVHNATTSWNKPGSPTMYCRYLLRGESTARQNIWGLNVAEFDGHLFILRFNRSEDGTCFAWTTVVGGPDIADAYTAEIMAYGNNFELRKKCRVHGIDRDGEVIVEEADCFQISKGQVVQCRVAEVEDKWRRKFSHRVSLKLTLQKSNNVEVAVPRQGCGDPYGVLKELGTI